MDLFHSYVESPEGKSHHFVHFPAPHSTIICLDTCCVDPGVAEAFWKCTPIPKRGNSHCSGWRFQPL